MSQLKPTQSEKPLHCPACESQFWLTWQRYATSLTGAQTCPSCGVRSRNNRPLWTHLYSLLGLLVGLLSAGLLLALGASAATAISAFELVGIVCVAVLDRHLDARLGKLVPFKTLRKQRTGGNDIESWED